MTKTMRVAMAGLACMAGLVIAAPGAAAQDGGSPGAKQPAKVHLTPAKVRPNKSFHIRANCGKSSKATVNLSSLGGSTKKEQMTKRKDGKFGFNAVAPGKPGSYKIKVACSNGKRGHAWLGVRTSAMTGAEPSTGALGTSQLAAMSALGMAGLGGAVVHRRRRTTTSS